MIDIGSAPEPHPSPRERLKQAATVAAGLARRFGPALLAGAVGWVCGYGLLGEQLRLSALPSPLGKLPGSWLLPFQKGALTFVAEAFQSLALPRGQRMRWAWRGATAAMVAIILWQWRSLDHGQGLLLYGALVAGSQFAPTQLWQRARGVRALGWWGLWILARTVTWCIAMVLTGYVGQRLGPWVGWALGGALSGLSLVLFLRLGPQQALSPAAPPVAVPSPAADRIPGTKP